MNFNKVRRRKDEKIKRLESLLEGLAVENGKQVML